MIIIFILQQHWFACPCNVIVNCEICGTWCTVLKMGSNTYTSAHWFCLFEGLFIFISERAQTISFLHLISATDLILCTMYKNIEVARTAALLFFLYSCPVVLLVNLLSIWKMSCARIFHNCKLPESFIAWEIPLKCLETLFHPFKWQQYGINTFVILPSSRLLGL